MINLHNMTETEFSEYRSLLVEDYAHDIANNYRITLDETRAKSANQIGEMLKDGLATPNQWLYEIRLEDNVPEERIGYLWIDVDETKKRCFICDIYLHEVFRGQGWGRKTLELLEKQMLEKNIQRIGLHVFGNNSVARALYEKLGFEITGLNMQKWLTPPEHEASLGAGSN